MSGQSPTVRVAAVQCSSKMGSKEGVQANAVKMERMAREAAHAGAKIIVFPEACLTGYTSQAFLHNWHVPGRHLEARFAGINPRGIVPTAASAEVRRLVTLAGELGVYMSIPFVEEADADQETSEAHASHVYYNTVILASPEGKVAAHYRKANLWPYVDKSWATAGHSPAVVETEYGRVGLGVCFDIHRIHKLYAQEPALWTLLYSVAWVGDREAGPTEQWFRQDLSRQYLGRDTLCCNVIAANWSVDTEYKWDGAGYSSIYNHRGERIASLRTEVGDEILYAELPMAASRASGLQTSTETEEA